MKELTPRNFAWGAAVLVALCSSQLCYPILAGSVRQLDYLAVNFSCQITTGVLCLAVIVLSDKDKRWQVWSSIALFPMLEAGRYLLGGMIFWIAGWWSPYGPMLTVVLLVLFVLKLVQVNHPGLVTGFINFILSGRSTYGARAGMRTHPSANAPHQSTLESASSLVIEQKADWAEAIPFVKRKNRYVVNTSSGVTLLTLDDTSHATKNVLFRRSRPFTFQASRSAEDKALQFHIPKPSFFSLGDWEMSVTDTAGRLLGKVRVPAFSTPPSKITVYDGEGQELYQVVVRPRHLWNNWDFAIVRGGVQIGSISNEWGGLAQEMLTDADTYRMTFPHDLPVTHKHLLLGALLMLDLRSFER